MKKFESNADDLEQIRKLKKEQAQYDKERAELDRKAIKDQHALLEKATR